MSVELLTTLAERGERFARSLSVHTGILGISWLESRNAPVFSVCEYGTMECSLLRLCMLNARALGIDHGDIQLDTRAPGGIRCLAQSWGGHATAVVLSPVSLRRTTHRSIQRSLRTAMWRAYGVKPAEHDAV